MTERKKKTIAIIPSAGLGRRMGTLKKNYLTLLGRPVLAHTLAAFEACASIDAVIVVTAPEDIDRCASEAISPYGFKKVVKIIAGGAERQDSVANGIECAAGFDIIAVHDGARPLVTPDIIEAVVAAAGRTGAAISAVPVKDTIKEAADGLATRTVDRTSLVSVHTPQAFSAAVLVEASAKARQDGFTGTDESSLVERLGAKVTVVPGSYENIKITTPEDLALAEWILDRRANGQKPAEGRKTLAPIT